jgi:hypothetical protein
VTPARADRGGRTGSGLWTSLALFAAPLYLLVVFPLTPILLAGVAWLLGPRVWTGQTARRSLVVGGVTAAAFVGAGVLVYVFGFGLCAPDSGSTLTLAAVVGAATYTAGCLIAVKNPWIWPVSLLAAAVAFDVVVQVAIRTGVRVIC